MREIIDGYTEGHYALPDPVVQHHRALEAVRAIEAAGALPVDHLLAEAKNQLIQELIGSSLAGKPDVPDDEKLSDIRRQAEAKRDLWEIRYEAERQLERRLGGAIREHAHDVLKNLRGALNRVMKEARVAADKLEGLPIDASADALALAPKSARDAWETLTRLSESYCAVFAAYRKLPLNLPPVSADVVGIEFKDDDRLWPERSRVRTRAFIAAQHAQPGADRPVAPPWPEQFPAKLLWIIRHNATPWLPDAAELDAHLERVVAQRREKRAGRAAVWTR